MLNILAGYPVTAKLLLLLLLLHSVYVEKTLKNFPLLKLVNEKVISHPNIASYKELRPITLI